MQLNFEDALRLGEELFFSRKYGIARVKRELFKKQFSEEVIDRVVEELNPGLEERHIKHIILNKYGRKIFIDQERDKIVRLMSRFGYPENKTIYVLDSLERAEL